MFVGGWAIEQLWLFWIAPIVGAAIAGIVYTQVFGAADEEEAAPVKAKASKAGR